ncbi:MAG: hypothetical protein NC084_11105 [Bacteroides sp.]|nr:glycoside hydrolase family 2 protein [Eubacterium sp.]MCM1419402.1 glycoside hydrolase family 2 protein [Roseburia sp.]MCM1463242.1 hypothetical protein [Bacteroides sp.]
MIRISLDRGWRMKQPTQNESLPAGDLPVSMYETLLKNGKIDDPYYRENEAKSRELSRGDYDFKKSFPVERSLLACDEVLLRLEGVDTLADLYINNIYVGSTDNMFRTYEFPIKDRLAEGENKLKISLRSPIRYLEEAQKARPIYGMDTNIAGYPHLRKAHYMTGWDWGPRLPDLGIYRSVSLLGIHKARIGGVYFRQKFSDDFSALTLTVTAETIRAAACDPTLEAELILADGRVLRGVLTAGSAVFKLANPALWYPRGYGGQPLNKVTVRLYDGTELLDSVTETIGFRELTVRRDDERGIFCLRCNGFDLFAMGANVIPLDQLLPRITPERTKAFLRECVDANYNTLRIWGGGLYPSDLFLKECDRLGLIVWEDFMFACSAYRLTEALEETIRAEIRDNVRRMRNHACLALWCGNNEIESMWEGWGIPRDDEAKADYVRLFEEIIPEILHEEDPDRFYWPSSPSSGGDQYGEGGVFHGSSDNRRGDQHYWDIWHNFKPLTEFRKFDFPFCSEYGFESIPCLKTVRSFAEEGDLNLCSPVLENHQKCTAGNEKLLYYIAQHCRYPYSFEKLIYASQLVQSDAIRSNVEHMRRKRGKCMGSLYWQVNDSNPVISWSSLDYFGRRKGLHYAAKRFYAPVLLSCLEEDVSAVLLNVSNETRRAVKATVLWRLRDARAEILTSGSIGVSVPPLTARDAATLSFGDYFPTERERRARYLEYALIEDGKILSKGTSIFVRPKSFRFDDPEIRVKVEEKASYFLLTFTARAFAKSVALDLTETDAVFSDNWFDINGDEPVEIVLDKNKLSAPLTSDELSEQLTVTSCFDLQ